MNLYVLFTFLSAIFTTGSCYIWCYSCVSSQPGCGDKLDWRIHHAITCPKEDDKCVKIIERRGAERLITRDCVSSLDYFRRDIPADRYEGCRPAAKEPKRAVYVDNEIKQLELKENYYKNITFCFCEFDHWCNTGSRHGQALTLITLLSLGTYVFRAVLF